MLEATENYPLKLHDLFNLKLIITDSEEREFVDHYSLQSSIEDPIIKISLRY